MLIKIKQIFFILSKKEKNSFYLLIFLMLIGSFLEAVGLGLIIPFISVIVDSDSLKNFTFIPLTINEYIFSLEIKMRIIYFSILILGFYLFKNIFIGFLYYKINTFAFGSRSSISNRLFNLYLNKNYNFFMKTNSSKLISNIHNETGVYCEQALISILTMLTEILLILTISLFLLIYNPKITIIVFIIIFVISSIFQILTKPFIMKWGLQRQKSDQDKFKILSQGFGGIRELKIFDKLEYFKKKFEKSNNLLGKVSGYHATLQNIPKLYLELTAIVSFITIIIIIVLTANDISKLITILSLYGVAAFRMLPSANKVIHSQQNIRFSTVSIERLYQEFNDTDEKDNYINTKLNDIPESWEKLVFDKVSFFYEVKEKKVFDNLNIEIKKGSKIGILGETGIGKSTFFDLLCGLVKPSSGNIYLDKNDISKFKLNDYLKKFGYVSQSIFLFDDTIKNNICFEIDSIKGYEHNNLNKILRIVKLEQLIDNLELGVDTIIGEKGIKLSGGQRQRIGLARALFSNPELLILDEATNALDELTEKNIIENLHNEYNDQTIVYISHSLNTLKRCDHIYEIKDKIFKKIK